MKTTFITLITLAFTASAQLVKLEGAKAVQYKEASGVKLFLHVFNPEGHKTTDARPAIVFFFGGGWNGGTPKQFEPHCQYLARRGMVEGWGGVGYGARSSVDDAVPSTSASTGRAASAALPHTLSDARERV